MSDIAFDAASASKGGFWVRLVAALIDGVILAVVNFVINLVVGAPLGSAVGIVVDIAYFAYFWTSSGATPGKQAMGLRVVSTDGSKLTVGKAIVRYVGYIINSIAVGIGFLWVAFDGNKQGWHDKIAGTYVVKSR